MANLLFFGRLADMTGKTFDTVTLPETVSTVTDLRVWLDQKHETENMFQAPEIKVAINNEFVDDNSALDGAQEIAFMPPVGGG